MKDTKYHRYEKCSYCGREISTGNLKRHEAVCLQNPKIIKRLQEKNRVCEFCGKKYSEEDNKSPRFCSQKCSNSYSSSKLNRKDTKEATCISCGKAISILKNASFKTAKCIECRSKKPTKEKAKRKKVNCRFCEREVSFQNIKLHERACDKNPEASHEKRNYRRADVREGYIYKTVNKLNGRFYVGKHRGRPESSEKYLGSGIALKRAIDKYGVDSFFKEILEYIPCGDLSERERFWIEKTEAFKNGLGYNMTPGGDGGPAFKGRKHSEETKMKIREKSKKRKPVSEEMKLRISNKLKGRVVSKETRKKISDKAKLRHSLSQG